MVSVCSFWHGIKWCIACVPKSLKLSTVQTLIAVSIKGPDSAVVENSDLVLECHLTVSSPSLAGVTWFKNGQPLTTDGLYDRPLSIEWETQRAADGQTVFTSKLTIQQTTLAENGIYVCRSENGQVAHVQIEILPGKILA